MKDLERLLYDMARWMKRAEGCIGLERPLTPLQIDELWLWVAEGRLLRERADRAVGFPRGVR